MRHTLLSPILISVVMSGRLIAQSLPQEKSLAISKDRVFQLISTFHNTHFPEFTTQSSEFINDKQDGRRGTLAFHGKNKDFEYKYETTSDFVFNFYLSESDPKPENPKTGQIQIFVLDNGSFPVKDFNIYIDSSVSNSRNYTTDANGFCLSRLVPEGSRTAHFSTGEHKEIYNGISSFSVSAGSLNYLVVFPYLNDSN